MERDITLGPFFTLGAVLIGVALRRRSWLLAGIGAAAIAADQRLPFSRRLKASIRERGERAVATAEAQSPG